MFPRTEEDEMGEVIGRIACREVTMNRHAGGDVSDDS